MYVVPKAPWMLLASTPLSPVGLRHMQLHIAKGPAAQLLPPGATIGLLLPHAELVPANAAAMRPTLGCVRAFVAVCVRVSVGSPARSASLVPAESLYAFPKCCKSYQQHSCQEHCHNLCCMCPV
jgi:hypothetical protein